MRTDPILGAESQRAQRGHAGTTNFIDHSAAFSTIDNGAPRAQISITFPHHPS
jgi:hypothetical protein